MNQGLVRVCTCEGVPSKDSSVHIGTAATHKLAAQQSCTLPSPGMVEVLEDKLLRDVFACTLDAAQATSGGEAPITYLQAVHEVTERRLP